jgi:uncharacterized protein
MAAPTPLVIYHGNCPDGFTAAWVMRRWLMGWPVVAGQPFVDPGPEVEFFAAHYGSAGEPVDLPDVTGRQVWMVDFCTGREQLIALHEAAYNLIVLDHHKTAEAACEGLPYCTFDMERSGAMLAWDYCMPGVVAPWIVKYVEDRDLWRFALPGSEQVSAYLRTQEMTFENWDDIDANVDPLMAFNRGAGALDLINAYVRGMVREARRVTFAGYANIPVVNAPYWNGSELVNALAAEAQFAVAWFQRADGLYQYSLRSHGDFDVSAVAQLFGGGGHKNAAGFRASERVLCKGES